MELLRTNPNMKSVSIGAIPMWETKENLKPYLSETSMDRQRIKRYQEAKDVLDAYAREVIKIATACVAGEDMIPTYDNLETLFHNAVDVKGRAAYRKASTDFKRHMAGTIKKVADEYQLVKEFGKLFTKDKSALYQHAKEFGISSNSLSVLELYQGFTTYFSKYFTSLSDVILCGTEHGSIARRILENMETFWRNRKILDEMKEGYPELFDSLNSAYDSMCINMCMSQDGIDAYNLLLGNMENSGVNSLINLYAQKNHVRIKLLKQLNKIPLVKVEKQVVINSIEDNEELSLVVIDTFKITEKILDFAERWRSIRFDDAMKDTTFFLNKNLNMLSHKMYGNYDLISRALKEVPLSDREKDEQIVSIRSIELAMKLIDETPRGGYGDVIREYFADALSGRQLEKTIRGLCEKNVVIQNRKMVKQYFDCVLQVRKAASYFYTAEIENVFIEDLSSMKDAFFDFNTAYNMVRNYCTKNPIEKACNEMYFNNASFLNSFDANKFQDGTSMSTLLRKDGLFYLYVMNPAVSRKPAACAFTEEGGYDRLVYKQLPGLNKTFPRCFASSKKAEELYGTTDEIRDIVENKRYTKEADDRESCVKWIQFCIDAFQKNPDWMRYYKVPFKKAEEYTSANDFYTQTEKHTIYMAWSEHLSEDYVRQSVKDGTAFLFKLYNHDFSPCHTGKDGNYTRIIKELFSEENLQKINATDQSALKLCGGAKLLFRKASIPYKVTHEACEELANKNPLNPKKTSTFSYELCKDRRFMTDSFILRFGVQIGFRNEEISVYESNRYFNCQVQNGGANILTIRAGEEHLLYYLVSDRTGKILEQGSLNTIESHSEHFTVIKDYKTILAEREKAMAEAKEAWDYSVDIKDVRNAYVACAIHVLLSIRDKYDAVIFLEDYSGDFVSRRRANVKAVYQQLQTALLNKLSCYVPAGSSYSEAVQLAVPVSSLDDLKGQKGIVYFVNAAYTANTDHTSGFCNQYYEAFTYENMHKASAVCEKLKITFDEKHTEFLISLNEDNFGFSTSKKWLLHSKGIRSIWQDGKVKAFDCTSELAELMKDYHMSDFSEYKTVADKAFYVRFFNIMKVLLKMHYSDPSGEDSFFLSPVTGYDSRTMDDLCPNNSTSEKTYLVMLKGKRDLDNIDSKTLLITRDEKGKQKENWLSYLENVV